MSGTKPNTQLSGYTRLLWARNFVSNFFDKEMQEGETLVVVLDNEKLPELETYSLMKAFCSINNISFLYGNGINLDGKKIYFVNCKMQTVAGYSGHSIVLTSDEISRQADSIRMSISMHKRWHRYVLDVSNLKMSSSHIMSLRMANGSTLHFLT
ncbi:TPA: hypothetical protein NG522_001541 [Vibrio parahaemolyticus]|nr:hypothetical protein [Vibrio parahaemolyticus]HCE3108016.1 hypothetical protein [Vibrio parahaemolyticus]